MFIEILFWNIDVKEEETKNWIKTEHIVRENTIYNMYNEDKGIYYTIYEDSVCVFVCVWYEEFNLMFND